MQKVINVLALASFAVSTAIVAGGAYVYLNKDAMIESAKQAATKAATEAVTSALPGLLDACLLYTSPSPRDLSTSRMPSSA